MDKNIFQTQLDHALQRASAFASTYLLEPLPQLIRCRIQLNSSFDKSPFPDDVAVFPQDSAIDRAFEIRSVTPRDAAELLCRSGKVPVWIDVSVVSKTETSTIVELRAAGRYSANEQRYYYETEQGRWPFGIKGPCLPPSYDPDKRERFSIHHRASCWTCEEYQALVPRRRLARSLELGGPEFDDDFLASIDGFSDLDGLVLQHVPLQGRGMPGLSQLPALRWLRLSVYPRDSLDISQVGKLSSLQSLTLDGLSLPPSDLSRLNVITPSLVELTLRSQRMDRLIVPDLPNLQRLEICCDDGESNIALSNMQRLNTLSLHGPFDDEQVRRMLASLPQIRSLHLDDTLVGQAVVDFIRQSRHVEYANLQGTAVTSAAIRSLRDTRPDMRIHAD